MFGPVGRQRLLHALLVVLGVVALAMFVFMVDAVLADIAEWLA